MESKEDSLKANGSFNWQHTKVRAELFKHSPFFDAKDAVQVKYEMLRAVANNEGGVTSVAGDFGFSRKAYYQSSKAYEDGGLNALMPKKHGPKGPNKLHGKVSEFIDSYSSCHKDAKAKEISEKLETELGVRVHPRTIERFFEKKTFPNKSK
jgi:transposase